MSSRLKFVKSYKTAKEGAGMHDYLFWINAQSQSIYVFQMPKLKKKIICEIEVVPAYHMIKKLKIDQLWIYMLHVDVGYWISEYNYSIEQ